MTVAPLKVHTFPVGPLDVNCYLVHLAGSSETIAIDPGGNGEMLLHWLQAHDLKLMAILNTHGHGDHIGAVDFLCAQTGAKFYLHRADVPMLHDPTQNLSVYFSASVTAKEPDDYLEDGEDLQVAHMTLHVLHTPGHSPGGVCLYCAPYLFSGDSLFQGAIGRTDFPQGSLSKLLQSLHDKVLPLPAETQVLPGHGPATTLEIERRENPYLTTVPFA